MEDKDTPRYLHPCSNCKFLGQYEKFDLYTCSNYRNEIQTLVARYSNIQHHYYSGLEVALSYGGTNCTSSISNDGRKILFEALRRATAINHKPPSYLL